MDYVNLGRTGLKVSRICLGVMSYGSKTWRQWVLEEEEARPFLRRALDLGINFFDSADVYSLGESERILGKCLTEFGVNRECVVIASKVHGKMGEDPNQKGLSRKHIFHSYIGASAMYAWQFCKMLYTADKMGLTRFSTMQNYYNLVYREEEREMIPLCREEGIGLIPFSPLARGFVIGNRRKGDFGDTVRSKSDEFSKAHYYREEDFQVVQRVTEVAAQRGANNAQIAMAWVLAQPGITAPIIGATKMEHLDDAMAATTIKLSAEEMKALNEPYRPRGILMHQ